jgi:hypothetical protein
MTVPKWMVTLLSLGAAAVGALIAGFTVSYRAGEKLTALTVELAHVRETLTPAVVAVGVHEARLGVVETRLGYCCQPGSPRASLDADPTKAIAGVW